MYKADHEAGVLRRPITRGKLPRTDSVERRLFYGDSRLHKVMLSQAADSFVNISDSALKLEDTVDASHRVNIGIIGCGRIGQLHAANVATKVPNAELVCVSDYFEEAARRVAKRFHVPMACTDYHDLIDNADVHAIIVCSPTDTHADIIRAAADAGKHLFCEKPIDQNLAVIDDLAAVVRDANVKFFVGFQRRFDGNFVRAKKARDAGFLGTPLKLHLVSRDPAPPPVDYLKKSGGIFLDQTAHDFDMARFLVGSDITEIMATGIASDPEIAAIGDHDHTICHLKFANGVIGTIDNSRSSPMGYDQRAEFFGTNGSISVQNSYPNAATYCDRTGTHKDNPMPFFMERYAEAYLQEMMAFVDCVVEDTPVPCSIVDGRLPVVYAAAAKKSIEEGRPVKIEEVDPFLGVSNHF